MDSVLLGSGKNAYRFITIAADGYRDRQLSGRIHHEALADNLQFNGLIDMMLFINQIFDRTKVPKQTVCMRTFGGLKERECCFRTGKEDRPVPELTGSLATFRLFMKYRYYASWQGTLFHVESNTAYEFDSFLELAMRLDALLCGQEMSVPAAEDAPCSCQIAVERYDGREVEGHLQKASLNYRKQFGNVMELALVLSGLSAQASRAGSGNVKLISGETLCNYQKGGRYATFAVRILFREHHTWQGKITFREKKEERTFRSFMEMVYLMVSAMDAQKELNDDVDAAGYDMVVQAAGQ